MPHLRPYSIHHAILEAFVSPAIGLTPIRFVQRRAFSHSMIVHQKLSRKQRAQADAAITPEDLERVRKAKERAAQRTAKKAEQAQIAPRRQGSSAQRLLESIRENGTRLQGSQQQSKDSRPPENEEILELSRLIHLIDRENRYLRKVDLRGVLDSLDRSVEKIIVVKGNDKAEGENAFPVCKIFTHQYLLEKKRKIEGRSAELAKDEKAAKELELNWTIGPADLDLKCRQMAKFLSEGRRLDVTIERKFKRREPDMTPDEMQGLIDQLSAVVGSVKGAREYREREGKLGWMIKLFYEGPKGGNKKKAEDAGAQDLPEPEIAGAAAS